MHCASKTWTEGNFEPREIIGSRNRRRDWRVATNSAQMMLLCLCVGLLQVVVMDALVSPPPPPPFYQFCQMLCIFTAVVLLLLPSGSSSITGHRGLCVNLFDVESRAERGERVDAAAAADAAGCIDPRLSLSSPPSYSSHPPLRSPLRFFFFSSSLSSLLSSPLLSHSYSLYCSSSVCLSFLLILGRLYNKFSYTVTRPTKVHDLRHFLFSSICHHVQLYIPPFNLTGSTLKFLI